MKGDGLMRANFARVALSLAAGGCLILTNASSAEDPKPEKAPAKKEAPAKPKYKAPLTEDQVKVPDGKPDELEKIMQQAGQTAGESGLQRLDGAKLYIFTTLKAADKILAHKDATDQQKSRARSGKFHALQLGERIDKVAFGKRFEAIADDVIKNQPDSPEAQLAVAIRFYKKHLENIEPSKQATDELVKFAKTQPNNPHLGELFGVLANSLEGRQKAEEAKALLKTGIELSKNKQSVAVLQRTLKKLSILGSVLEIAGPTLAGSEFDIKSLKGKVVLVDFWATWCGPCVGELPNVKKVYEKHHAKGFEIIAVSLDNDRSALEQFVKDEKITWTQIIFSEPKQMGWNSPLAKKHMVESIPATFLVDREGKVVMTNVRGEKALDDAVSGLLNKKPKAPLAN